MINKIIGVTIWEQIQIQQQELFNGNDVEEKDLEINIIEYVEVKDLIMRLKQCITPQRVAELICELNRKQHKLSATNN